MIEELKNINEKYIEEYKESPKELKKYELIKNVRDGFDLEEMNNKYTEYFENFDYIVGDWAYGKLRLKGFYDSNNKSVTIINDIKYIDKYIEENCAYGCRYFLLKKVKKGKDKND